MNDPKKLGLDLGKSEHKAVFVVGPPRSGTTLLRLVLNANKDLCIPAETWYFPKLIRRSKIYGDFQTEKQIQAYAHHVSMAKAESMKPFSEVFKFPEKKLVSTISKAGVTNYAEAYSAVMTDIAQRDDKSRWGDKSTFYSAYLETLAECFPKAKFIGLVRDPRAVVDSLHHTSWGKETYGNVINAAMRWRYGMESMQNAKAKLGDRLKLVKYEDFVADPEAIGRELCEFCELEFEQSMLEFHTTAKAKVPIKAREWQENSSMNCDGSGMNWNSTADGNSDLAGQT